jgi:hypothetical protein
MTEMASMGAVPRRPVSSSRAARPAPATPGLDRRGFAALQSLAGNRAVAALIRPSPAVAVQRQIPEVTPKLTDDITKGRGKVWAAYRRLLTGELSWIRAKVRTLKRSDQPQWENRVKRSEESMSALEISPSDVRALLLPAIIKEVNQCAKDLRSQPDGAPATGKSELVPVLTKAPFTKYPLPKGPVKDNPDLELALGLLERVGSADLVVLLPKMFGSKHKEAGARLSQIPPLLKVLYHKGRFVFDPDMSPSMMAMGNHSRRLITLSTSAVNGTRSAEDLAAALLHEGAHVLEPAIIDYAYVGRGDHYFLPAELAVDNAANYEQVVYDVLGHHRSGGKSARAPDEVERMRRGEVEPARLVEAELRFLATRAWIRGFDLKGDVRLELAAQFRPVLDLPERGTHTAPLIRAIFSTLYEIVNKVHDIAEASTVTGGLHDVKPYAVAGQVVISRNDLATGNIHDLALAAMSAVCAAMYEAGLSAFTAAELMTFITSLEQNDRPLILRNVRAYLEWFRGQAPGPQRVRDLEEYAQARSGTEEF